MICANCGASNVPGQKFCGDCGTLLGRACPNCGAPFPEGRRFCGDCGTALTSDVGASQTSSQEGGPITERRLVSVMFADLVGFTPFAEERDAEDTRDMLGRYADLSRELIERYGGVVEKFIGDAVMAVWGAPVAREDDAERAVRAALELVDAIPALGPGIQARAGVLSGEVAVNIGATNQGLVVGDIVNTAARLQSAAQPGVVLVGEATMRAASSAIAFEAAGDQVLKGKTAPVPAWRALRVVAQRGGEGRSALPEPPFVGRHDELRELKELIATTGRDRRTRLVSITGPAGIGKSRLAWELEKYIDGINEPIYWNRGRSPSYGEGVTFWALGEMVRRRAGLSESDDSATTRTRIAETVAEYVASEEDRRWVEPALLTLLGVEPAPAGGRDVLFAAWRIFFEQVAEHGTTILLFEDLHWADSGLLDFIEHTLEWARNVPLIVITLARPELVDRRPDWGATTRHLTKLALEPLTDPEMRELLEGFVPGLPDSAVATILRRADGVPLYAVETVRALLADGRVAREGDAYRPTGSLVDLAIPETLRSLIASRLDGLDAIERGLIADASVLGQSFGLASLAAVSGLAGDALDARLRALVRRELLDVEVDPRSPEHGQYRFMQSLIREVAYGTLARRERRVRHLAAARYFEATTDEELAGVLASHYVAAHEASAPGPEADAVAIQARLALGAAAERATALGSPDQALAYLRQAVALTADDRERFELLIRAAGSADAAGRFDPADALVTEAVAIAERLGDRTEIGRAQALRGDILIDRGQTQEALVALESAVELLTDPNAVDARAGLLSNLSRAQMRASLPEESIRTADLALDLAEHRGLDRIVAETFNNKGSSLGYLGRNREARALLKAAVDIAHEGGFVAAELRALSNLGTTSDEPLVALEITRSTEALGRRLGNRTMATWAGSSARWYHAVLGRDWDATIRECAEVEREARESGGAGPLDEIRNLSIWAIMVAARGGSTAEMIARIEALLPELSDPYGASSLHFLLGDRAFLDSDYSRAVDELDQSSTDVWTANWFIPWAIRAAVWTGELRRVRAMVERLEESPATDSVTVANRIAGQAAIAALEGRTAEAVTGFREAIGRLAELGCDFDVARLGLDLLRLVGPTDPFTRDAVGRSQAIFERLEAKPYLALLDATLEAAPAAAPRPAKPAGVRT
jgi:class 3 adenylate cyclase/tetratricopeptide (TPR) repeat protein